MAGVESPQRRRTYGDVRVARTPPRRICAAQHSHKRVGKAKRRGRRVLPRELEERRAQGGAQAGLGVDKLGRQETLEEGVRLEEGEAEVNGSQLSAMLALRALLCDREDERRCSRQRAKVHDMRAEER